MLILVRTTYAWCHTLTFTSCVRSRVWGSVIVLFPKQLSTEHHVTTHGSAPKWKRNALTTGHAWLVRSWSRCKTITAWARTHGTLSLLINWQTVNQIFWFLVLRSKYNTFFSEKEACLHHHHHDLLHCLGCHKKKHRTWLQSQELFPL